jgi:hypothetical protein
MFYKYMYYNLQYFSQEQMIENKILCNILPKGRRNIPEGRGSH